jgi:hypothetical protein
MLARNWIRLSVLFALMALLLNQRDSYACDPQPPCEKEAIPAYPALDAPAFVKSWKKTDFANDWVPPQCTGWTASGFTTLITIAARFRSNENSDGLLLHFGAISDLAGMRYWSATHKQWRILVVDAYALTNPQLNHKRKDFTADELKQGGTLYFEQVDNLSGKSIYKMKILEASPLRIVIDVENFTPVRFHFIPVFDPGELQSIYFLDRETAGVWRYYSIVRTGKHANHLIAGNESSAINRAVAFYRHFVGIPTDSEPPAAR